MAKQTCARLWPVPINELHLFVKNMGKLAITADKRMRKLVNRKCTCKHCRCHSAGMQNTKELSSDKPPEAPLDKEDKTRKKEKRRNQRGQTKGNKKRRQQQTKEDKTKEEAKRKNKEGGNTKNRRNKQKRRRNKAE